nr:biotin carboxylase N-terminal domain-containing protein [Streptomonospora litoralis]
MVGPPLVFKAAYAGRGAVHVARSCRDAGIASAAVYAASDCAALHVTVLAEAHVLGEDSPVEVYLDEGRLIEGPAHSGADAVHPSCGFLSEFRSPYYHGSFMRLRRRNDRPGPCSTSGRDRTRPGMGSAR